MIPMVDLKPQYQALKAEIDHNILAALDATQFILGPNVKSFETEAAKYLGVKYAIGVANGTDALHLALIAAGIGANDEVITSAFTFIATAEAISYTGATIKFADIDEQTFNLNPESIARQITKRTKAILIVHLFGQPVNMPAIQALAEQHNLVVIEDSCQSFGASINGQQTGSLGLAGCFSFFPSKNLGGFGDGGLVTTNDDKIAETVLALRNHGSKVRYYHSMIGYNSRLDELQAVILRAKLVHIDEYSKNRRRVAHLYNELLQDLPIKTPHQDNIGEHVYHQYTILSDNRDAISLALSEQKIGNAIYYPVPLHRQDVYQAQFANINLPVTEMVSEKCLSLPIYPELSDDKVKQIAAVITSVYG